MATCPKCDEPAERITYGNGITKWFCARRSCNQVFDLVPVRPSDRER